ncbi:MAG: hypothetical protein AAF491_05125 [Verrucomicrobiota bacterium]
MKSQPVTFYPPATLRRFRQWALSILTVAALLFGSYAISNETEAPASPDTEVVSSISSILSTRVIDLDGQVNVLGEGRPPKPVALVFIGPDCPIARQSVETLNELVTRHENIQVFGVLSSPDVDRVEAVEFRDEFGVTIPILLDSVGDLALRLQPTTIPEAFLVGGGGEIVYRGAIDDRFASPGRPRKQPSANYLSDAIDAVAEGRQPPISSTEAVGCIFESWDPQRLPDTVTYHQHIAPIVNANCIHCHREGQSAPFALTDYSLARRKSKMMAWVSEEQTMPPWSAKPGFNRFVDQRVLSDRQIEAFEAWARSGAEEGEPSAAFPLPSFPPAEEWPLGEPDLVLKVPEPFLVHANGEDIYRHFIIPTGLTEDKQMVAMDFRPGEPEVVHHVIFYRDSTGKAQKLSGKDGRPGYDAFSKEARSQLVDSWGIDVLEPLGGWAPGQQPYQLPDDTALAFPAEGDIVLEVHYHPNGREVSDQSEVALYFADKPVKHLASGLVAGTEDIDIPPGEAEYKRHVWVDVKTPITVLDVAPHMHLIGKEMKAVATLPDGTEEPLIWIQDWDFRWQDTYTLSEPLYLPKGSRVDFYSTFDNSSANPYNPYDPPQRITEGEATTDEMNLLFMTVLLDNPEHEEKLFSAMIESYLRPGSGEKGSLFRWLFNKKE